MKGWLRQRKVGQGLAAASARPGRGAAPTRASPCQARRGAPLSSSSSMILTVSCSGHWMKGGGQ